MADQELDSTAMAAFFRHHENSPAMLQEILGLLKTMSETKTEQKTVAKKEEEPVTPAENKKLLAWEATTEVLQKQLEQETSDTQKLRKFLEETLAEKSKLEDELKALEKERDSFKHDKELLVQKLEELGHENTNSETQQFPSNETILHNLLVAQLEFYFSNHHLKRDKPLMEKICSGPNTGFLTLSDVTTFPKIRTLGQPDEIVMKATRASKYLEVKQMPDGSFLVGRTNFTAPKPAEFPFRRTVFVYGINPAHENEQWIREQFQCFGKIAKVKFDSGPHTLPRKVGARLLSNNSNRVVRLHMRDSEHTEYVFRNSAASSLKQYMCHECKKMKDYKDGFYIPNEIKHMDSAVFCVQCAAKKAESNLDFYQTRKMHQYKDPRELEEILGIDNKIYDDRNLQSFRTCLVVFESQRQASKCVYVRSRLGIEGCFATHFHNYTRHKREISQGNELEPVQARPMMKQSSGFRLQEQSMRHSRHTGVRIEGMGGRFGGLSPPMMRKNQSAPTLNHRRGFPSNNRFSRI